MRTTAPTPRVSTYLLGQVDRLTSDEQVRHDAVAAQLMEAYQALSPAWRRQSRDFAMFLAEEP